MRSTPGSVNQTSVLPAASCVTFICSGWRDGSVPGSGGKTTLHSPSPQAGSGYTRTPAVVPSWTADGSTRAMALPSVSVVHTMPSMIDGDVRGLERRLRIARDVLAAGDERDGPGALRQVGGRGEVHQRVGPGEGDPVVAGRVDRLVERERAVVAGRRDALEARAVLERHQRRGLVARLRVAEPQRERVGGNVQRQRRLRAGRDVAAGQRRPGEAAPVVAGQHRGAVVERDGGDGVGEAVALTTVTRTRPAAGRSDVRDT